MQLEPAGTPEALARTPSPNRIRSSIAHSGRGIGLNGEWRSKVLRERRLHDLRRRRTGLLPAPFEGDL
jgi:hypothetical protein